MSRLSKLIHLLIIMLASHFLVGCDKGWERKSGAGAPETVIVSGVAQKGPFTQLKVEAFTVDTNGALSADPVAVSETNDSSYSIELPTDTAIKLAASGIFIDEITGNSIELTKPLELIISADDLNEDDASETQQNINLFTHLHAQQVFARIDTGMTDLDMAMLEAQEVVSKAVNLGDAVEFKSLDILVVDSESDLSDPNLKLLMFSAMLMDQIEPETSMGDFGALDDLFSEVITGDVAATQLGDLQGVNVAPFIKKAIDILGLDPFLDNDSDIILTCIDAVCDFFIPDRPFFSIYYRYGTESNGEIWAKVQPPAGLNTPYTMIIQTVEEGGAIAGVDYLPVYETILVDEYIKDVGYEIDILTILDNVEESGKSINLHVSTDLSSIIYQPATKALLLERVVSPESGNIDEKVKLESICINGIGDAFDLEEISSCNPVSDFALHGERAAIKVTTELAFNDCGNTCFPQIEYLFEAFSPANTEVTLNSIRLGLLDVVIEQRGGRRYARDTQYLQGSADIKTFAETATSQGLALRLTAKLVGVNNSAINYELGNFVELPDEVQLANSSTRLSLNNGIIVPGAECDSGQYLVEGEYASDLLVGDQVITQAICLEVDTVDGVTTATMVSDEIDLSGLEIDLPSFYSALPTNANGELLPRGVPSLSIPVTSNNQTTRYLHGDGIPIAFAIDGGVISPDGLLLSYESIRYLQHLDTDLANTQRPSNDIYYSVLSNQSVGGTLAVSASDITATIDIPGGKGTLAYPKGTLAWPQFSVSLSGRQLRLLDSNGDFDFTLIQSAQCRQVSCENSYVNRHKMTGRLSFDRYGNLLTGVTGQTGNQVSWGGIDEQHPGFLLENDFKDEHDVVLALPGYSFEAGSGSIDSLLKGHLRIDIAEARIAIEPLGSEEANNGNYFPTGITVGPQYLYSVTGDTEPDSSSILSPLAIKPGSESESKTLPLSAASKYVIRNDGVTGVFNIDHATMGSDFSHYGYPLKFTQFAFRLVDNTHDDSSQIHGSIHLPDINELGAVDQSEQAMNYPGAAGFDVDFESLAIACDGNFTSGLVVPAESQQSLYAWQANTDIYHLQFDYADTPSGNVCLASNQVLTLDQTVEQVALDKPVAATNVTWSPNGAIVSSQLLSGIEYLLEGTDDAPGFGFIGRGGQLQTLLDEQLYGVVTFEGANLASFFWQSPLVDIRTRNASTQVDDKTLVVGAGNMSQLTEQQNQTVVLSSSPDLDITAQRFWGNSDFGFTLPVYYSGGDSLSPPTLIGRYESTDVVVMEAGAGIEYITPVNTALNFGLSADIPTMAELPLNLDISSAASLVALDDFLNGLGIGFSVTDLLGPIQQPLQTIQQFTGAGFEGAIRNQVSVSLAANFSNDIESLQNRLSMADSIFPEMVGVLSADILNGFQSYTADAGYAYDKIITLDSTLSDSQIDLDEANDLIQTFEDAIAQIQESTATLDSLIQTTTGLANHISVLAINAQQNLSELTTDITALSTMGAQFQLAGKLDACIEGQLSVEDGVHLSPLLELTAAVNSVLGEFSVLNLETDFRDITAGDSDLSRAIATFESRLAAESGTLRQSWGSSSTGISASLNHVACVPLFSDSTDPIKLHFVGEDEQSGLLGTVAEIDASVSTLATQSGALIENLTLLMNAMKTSAVQLESTLQLTKTNLQNEIDASADNAEAVIDGQQYLDSINTSLEALMLTRALGITVLVTTDSTVSNDLSTAVGTLYSSITSTLDSLSSYIDSPLNSAGFDTAMSYEFLTSLVMETPVMLDVIEEVNRLTAAPVAEVVRLSLLINDQVKHTITGAVAEQLPGLSDLIADANGYLPDLPLGSANLDGRAVFVGGNLGQLHIDGEWSMQSSVDAVEGTSFTAALDIISNEMPGDDVPCSIGTSGFSFQTTLSGYQVPASLFADETYIDEVWMDFNLSPGNGLSTYIPDAIGGGIVLNNPVQYSGFTLDRFSFISSIGTNEAYIGAGGGGYFDSAAMEINAFVGRTCNDSVIKRIDPNSANLLPFDGDAFLGLYLRGEMTVPIVNYGCALRVGMRGSAGTWITIEPVREVGGIVGGGTNGEVACIGSIRGQIDAVASFDENGEAYFSGQAFGVAGAGIDCDRKTWTSVRRSRRDKYCGTGDIEGKATFENGKWSLDNTSPSAIH